MLEIKFSMIYIQFNLRNNQIKLLVKKIKTNNLKNDYLGLFVTLKIDNKMRIEFMNLNLIQVCVWIDAEQEKYLSSCVSEI